MKNFKILLYYNNNIKISNYFLKKVKLSIFKDKAIVLKSLKRWEKDMIYTLFSFEYWKIRVNKKYSKTEKNIDLWYIINFEIHTKEKRDIHKISNIKIKSEFDTIKNSNFEVIENYLKILTKIYTNLPDWLPNKEVFWVIEEINNLEKISKQKLILAHLKIKTLFWELNLEHKNIKISKILKFIHNSKIKDIFRLSGIWEDLESILSELL